MEFQAHLIKKENIAEGTMAFYFVKPDNFAFKAGQSIDLTLVNPPLTDDEGNKRAFSIASSPSEEYVMIATRLRDTAFKRTLSKMDEGTIVKIEGPFGSFHLHSDESRPAVALIGGIGITPIRSIFTESAEQKKPHELFLFYSNRRPEDAAFFREFVALTETNDHFHFIPTMTKMEGSAKQWAGEQGYINESMIKKYVDISKKPVYYISGPIAMVVAMRKILEAMGVSDDDIKTEEFTGY